MKNLDKYNKIIIIVLIIAISWIVGSIVMEYHYKKQVERYEAIYTEHVYNSQKYGNEYGSNPEYQKEHKQNIDKYGGNYILNPEYKKEHKKAD